MYPLLKWIYDKIVSHFPGPLRKLYKWCLDFYASREEMWDYLVFGGLAFVFNMVVYVICAKGLHIQYMVSTGIAWVLTVLFAYWTNREFVFKSKTDDKAGIWKEFVSFIGGRVFTGILQALAVYLIVDVLGGNDVFANLLGNVIAIVTNYIISKLLIFKKKAE